MTGRLLGCRLRGIDLSKPSTYTSLNIISPSTLFLFPFLLFVCPFTFPPIFSKSTHSVGSGAFSNQLHLGLLCQNFSMDSSRESIILWRQQYQYIIGKGSYINMEKSRRMLVQYISLKICRCVKCCTCVYLTLYSS